MDNSSLTIDISKVSSGEKVGCQDSVAVEEPLEIRLDFEGPQGRRGQSISITMRTPGNDFDLAIGFLYGESIIHSINDVREVAHCGAADESTGLRNVVKVELQDGVVVDLDRLQRHFYTTSSCGVCGKTSLEALRALGQSSLVNCDAQFSQNILTALPDKLRAQQKLFGETGGLHAAALFDTNGQLGVVKEDVGRHNAVDKVIGDLVQRGSQPANSSGLLVSGRASFELMQKALVAGVPLLAAVGAPSSLAVQLARDFDMTLVGFLRDGKFNIYAGEHRIS
jgi:FdhD protein